MRGRLPEYQPQLSGEDVRHAEGVLRRGNSPHVQVQRARIALELAREPKARCPTIARKVGVHPQMVRKWRKRWATEGFSLEDKPRPGRPKTFSPGGASAGQSDCV